MENLKVMVEVSARHIHVTQELVEILFGKGHELTVKKMLSQPGQYACEERVKVEGPKGCFPAVSILGPTRPETQLEISYADARTMGIPGVLRMSGDIAGTPGFTVTGPCGSVEMKEGAIVAKRHLHISPEDAAKYGIEDKETVMLKIDGERGLIFDELVARVSDKFNTAVHLDVDEGNAAHVPADCTGEIIKKK